MNRIYLTMVAICALFFFGCVSSTETHGSSNSPFLNKHIQTPSEYMNTISTRNHYRPDTPRVLPFKYPKMSEVMCQ